MMNNKKEYLMKEIERQQLKEMEQEQIELQKQRELDREFEDDFSRSEWEDYMFELEHSDNCNNDYSDNYINWSPYCDDDYWHDDDFDDAPTDFCDDQWYDYALAHPEILMSDDELIEQEIEMMEDALYAEEVADYLEHEYYKQEQELAAIQYCELSRKAPSRERHHSSEKAKKRAKISYDILQAKFKNLSWHATDDEVFRLSSRLKAAEKKAVRIL